MCWSTLQAGRSFTLVIPCLVIDWSNAVSVNMRLYCRPTTAGYETEWSSSELGKMEKVRLCEIMQNFIYFSSFLHHESFTVVMGWFAHVVTVINSTWLIFK